MRTKRYAVIIKTMQVKLTNRQYKIGGFLKNSLICDLQSNARYYKSQVRQNFPAIMKTVLNEIHTGRHTEQCAFTDRK